MTRKITLTTWAQLAVGTFLIFKSVEIYHYSGWKFKWADISFANNESLAMLALVFGIWNACIAVKAIYREL